MSGLTHNGIPCINVKLQNTGSYGQAIKQVESGSDILGTPCTVVGDSATYVGQLLRDGAAGDIVPVGIGGALPFLGGAALDATADLGQQLQLGAGGKMYKAVNPNTAVARWIARPIGLIDTNADIADGDLGWCRLEREAV